jgi:hypothetical protein
MTNKGTVSTLLSGPPGSPGAPGSPNETDAARRAHGGRRRLAFWDRVKFLLLFGSLWFFLVWSAMAANPLVGFRDAWLAREQSAR